MIKEGGKRKNWKRRYFVVRPNYTVDYYENEEVRILTKLIKNDTLRHFKTNRNKKILILFEN